MTMYLTIRNFTPFPTISMHDKNKTTESGPVDLKQVVEEIIDYIIG